MSGWLLMLDSVDERLLLAVVQRRRRVLDLVMRGVTRTADPVPAVIIALILVYQPMSYLAAAGKVALFTLVVSHLMVQLLKRTVCRDRPDLPVGIGSMVAVPDQFSFPSGHAAAALSLALPLVLVLPWGYALPVLTLGFVVSMSRCYLGVHYPGDVLAGWALTGASLGLGWLLELPSFGML